MHQHLETAAHHEYQGADQMHATHAVKDSLLTRLYGECFTVNSAHHQGVDSLGQCIVYTQFAKDGVVETLNHRYLPVMGVQWHPEYHISPADTAIFKVFVEACRSYGK